MPAETPKHLLLIRLSAIGDAAIAAPIVYRLRNKYPRLRLTILTREFLKPLFSQIQDVQVFSPDLYGKHKGILGLYRLSAELKALGVDAVADLHGVLRSHILTAFLKIRGVRVSKIDKGRAEKRALTRPTNKVWKPLKPSSQRYADVLAKLGLEVGSAPFPALPKLSGPPFLLLNKGFRRIGVAPFASYPAKSYPIAQARELVEALTGRDNFQIILFGGAEHAKLFHQWQGQYQRTVSAVGKYTFEEELGIISHLDLMISMDSANAHLAAMYGVPVVVVWGVTHPYAGFAPLGKHISLTPDRHLYPQIPTSVYGNKAPEAYRQAIASIVPSKILEAVDELLTD